MYSCNIATVNIILCCTSMSSQGGRKGRREGGREGVSRVSAWIEDVSGFCLARPSERSDHSARLATLTHIASNCGRHMRWRNPCSNPDKYSLNRTRDQQQTDQITTVAPATWDLTTLPDVDASWEWDRRPGYTHNLDKAVARTKEYIFACDWRSKPLQCLQAKVGRL